MMSDEKVLWIKESQQREDTLKHYYGSGKERCLEHLETVSCRQRLQHLSASEGPCAKIFIMYSK